LVRILIVDNYEPWRRFVTQTLEVRPDVQIVGEAQNGSIGIQMAIELQPDVVVLDIGLSDLGGIEAARHILKLAPKTRILFLTQNTSRDFVAEAMRIGAHGYVVKAGANQDLLPALDALLLGNRFISPSAANPGNKRPADK
jgi:two-component system NarL family response regulator